MDSKSISRKGVGVQVPASAPSPSARDPLAAALLPPVLHRLNNASQVLSNLGALLSAAPSASVLESRSDDFGWAARTIDELGWIVGLVASASGSDLLLDRRESAGLAPLVAAVRDALRREGRDLADPSADLPDLHPGVADGWQLPWAIASCLWSCARALPERGALEWRLDASALRCRAPRGPDVERTLGWIEANLHGARVGEAGGEIVLELSPGWLSPRSSP